MRALVPGGGGFVGRHMVAALVERDYEVDAVDLAFPAYGPQLYGAHPIRGDVRQFFARDDTPHYDLVIHCAAVVGGRTMIEGSPLLLATEDLSIDAALFGWALRHGPGRIVYFSSSAAYPIWMQAQPGYRLAEIDIDRWHSAEPDQTYGLVKLVGERLAAEAIAEGIPTHVFRPFSGYGSDQAPDYPFPAFIDRARRRADPFDVWGPGTQVRDFIHIDDIVEAVMAAVEQSIPLEPMNLGTGRGVSFDDLAGMVIGAVDGYSPTVVCHPDRPVGVQHRVADPARMLRFYKPQVTLEEGIGRALASAGSWD